MPRPSTALWLFFAAVCLALPPASFPAATGSEASELDGTTILERATAAAGGDGWANARSLVLAGDAEFWGSTGSLPRSRIDDYRMYREFDPDRTAAHGAEGKVRIIADHQGKPVWTVGFDGRTTWTEKGITPQAEADAFWASNMGFGILRHVRKPGFKAERVADDVVGPHALYMVRLTDPQGGVTLFGVDQASFAVRTMGFMTPKGWHERQYDEFVRLKNPDWLQARSVTLYYNGVKSNTVHWRRYEVNVPIDPAVFVAPAAAAAPTPAAAAPTPAALGNDSTAQGARIWLQCRACHSLQAGEPDKVGPNLHGLFGAKAGTLRAGYAYSPALKAAEFVWDAATLERWLENPAAMVPGTRMAYAGLPEADRRRALIAFLENATRKE